MTYAEANDALIRYRHCHSIREGGECPAKRCEECKWYAWVYDRDEVLNTAISSLDKLWKIEGTVKWYENHYPYKVCGVPESYDKYREGINDLIGVLDPILWPDGEVIPDHGILKEGK